MFMSAKIFQSYLSQDRIQTIMDRLERAAYRAQLHVFACRFLVFARTTHEVEWAIQRTNHLFQCDFARGTGESITAVHPAMAFYKSFLAEKFQYVRDKWPRKPIPFG